MAWYDSIVDTGTKVFNWMEENPTAASFVGGAASGILTYYSMKEQQDFEKQMREEEREYREGFGGASTTEAGKTAPILTAGGVAQGGVATMADAIGG